MVSKQRQGSQINFGDKNYKEIILQFKIFNSRILLTDQHRSNGGLDRPVIWQIVLLAKNMVILAKKT